ncbi:MAG: histidine phosphatase family protein [Gammaproteobacteria bacterium]|nr:histidine phosphatase family protein [Gammaproteobacteria bacterium]
MARLIVTFIRHGEYQQPPGVPSAHLPYPLTVSGMQQAAEAADRLMHTATRDNWNIYPVIDSSLQLRGWQSATIIASELEQRGVSDAEVESFEDLAERCLGSAANLTVTQIESIVAEDPRYDPLPAGWKSDSNFRIPLQGAESLMQAGERVSRHITATTDSLADEILSDTLKIFVGHGAAFRHAAVYMGLLTARQAVALSMFHCQPIYFERLSNHLDNNKWHHIGGEWKVRKEQDSNPD